MVTALVEKVTVRPDWTADMPAGMSPDEYGAYRRGYSRGCATYIRKYGGPGIVGAVPAIGTSEREVFRAQLTESTTAHMIARHDTAHKAGMSSLRKWRKDHGVSEPAPVRKPAARKSATAKRAEAMADAVGNRAAARVAADVPAEPVTVPAPMPAMTWAARKATRREIAATLRAQGIKPTGDAWSEACRAAGLVLS